MQEVPSAMNESEDKVRNLNRSRLLSDQKSDVSQVLLHSLHFSDSSNGLPDHDQHARRCEDESENHRIKTCANQNRKQSCHMIELAEQLKRGFRKLATQCTPAK